ncbi:MAG: hypothetical protein KJZ79_17255 [Bryobacteraceae bacterium]|nr:hypothetical protein [Bryobacteraceae bacterium]
MKYLSAAGSLVLWAAVAGWAQAPGETSGLPPRVSAMDYQTQAKVGKYTIAAEFTGHAFPTEEGLLTAQEYVAVELAIFGPADSKLVITATDFSLRINRRKEPLPSQAWLLATRNVRDPEWIPEGQAPVEKSKGGISGGSGQREPGAPPPPEPKPPVELLRSWQQKVRKAAIAEGERALPQAGLLFFAFRGKTESIRDVELVYEGPAGKAVIPLR